MGSAGVLKAIFTLNFNKRVAQKLRRIILLHIGPVIFNFHFPKAENHNFELVDMSMTPQKPLFLTLGPPNYCRKSRKYQICFAKSYYWKSQNLKNRKCCKRHVPTNPGDPFNKFLKIWTMGSISIKKHELGIWYFQLKELEQLKTIILIFN